MLSVVFMPHGFVEVAVIVRRHRFQPLLLFPCVYAVLLPQPLLLFLCVHTFNTSQAVLPRTSTWFEFVDAPVYKSLADG